MAIMEACHKGRSAKDRIFDSLRREDVKGQQLSSHYSPSLEIVSLTNLSERVGTRDARDGSEIENENLLARQTARQRFNPMCVSTSR